MRPSTLCLDALSSTLLAVPTCPAQQPAANQTAAADPHHWTIDILQYVQSLQPDPNACPLQLDLRHGSSFGQPLRVSPVDPSQPRASQVLDLTIHNPGPSGITSLDAILHLERGDAHLMPLAPQPAQNGQTLSMHLRNPIGAGQASDISWGVASLNPVHSLEILKVTYQDGSTWTAQKNSPCQFQPDPKMLISAR